MGELLDAASTVLCPHGGFARAATANDRVLISGVPIAPPSDLYVIHGCQASTSAGRLPCTLARFIDSASRVRIGGVPVLLRESRAVCEPSGAPATVAVTQSRVTGV